MKVIFREKEYLIWGLKERMIKPGATCEGREHFWSNISELMKRDAIKYTNGWLTLARGRDNLY